MDCWLVRVGAAQELRGGKDAGGIGSFLGPGHGGVGVRVQGVVGEDGRWVALVR